MFDWAILVDARRGKRTISEGKVDVYEQHTRDLAQIKRFVRKYLPGRYREIFREYDPKYRTILRMLRILNQQAVLKPTKYPRLEKTLFQII